MLKIGPHEILQILPGTFHLIVDRDAVPGPLRHRSDLRFSDNQDCYGHPHAAGYYRSNPGSEACDFGFAVLGEVYDALFDAHVAVVRRAARKRRHGSTRADHSKDLVLFLASETGLQLTQPAYIID
jgi:hypothetical protein